jgi:hypothetical protein
MKLLKTLFKAALIGVGGIIGLFILVAIFAPKQTPQQRAASDAKRYEEQQADLREREAKEALAKEKEAKAQEARINGSDYRAYDAARDFMQARLKAPATAKFADYSDSQVLHVVEADGTRAKGSYIVKSWVDSQNGFGAMLRSHYSCEVKTDDGEHFRLVKLATR